MKKNYIIPTTITDSFRTEYLCQASVGSVHGSENLGYGGPADPNNPGQQPF